MSNNTEQFDDIARALSDELSLISDDDQRIKELEKAEALNKRIDEIELDEQDYIIMDELCILRYLPDSLVHQEFGTDSLNAQKFYSLYEENPTRANHILNKLLKCEPKFDEKVNIEAHENEKCTIEHLMDKLHSSNEEERDDASNFLEMRFWGNPCHVKSKS